MSVEFSGPFPLTMPPLPWDGGCRCGETRIRVTLPPILTMACHCAGCQSMTAAPYSLTMGIPADGFAVTKGETVIGGMREDPKHHFCPVCMSWMFSRPDAVPHLIFLRPTMLDEHHWVAPFVECCTSERMPWAVTPARHSYEQFPPMEDYPGLIEAFQAQLHTGAD
ncbi:MAG: GFA family protein [Flavobacteriaceae bacterium]